MKRKILALLMALVLCATMLPVTALAYDQAVVVDIPVLVTNMNTEWNHYWIDNGSGSSEEIYADESEIERGSFQVTLIAQCQNGYQWSKTYRMNYQKFRDSYDISYELRNPASVEYSAKNYDFSAYTFDGWHYADGTPFTTSVYEDVTLYATWTPDPSAEFQVSFDLNGAKGTTPDPITVTAGETIDLPVPALEDGYTFKGWLYQGKEWTADMPVYQNMVLSADCSYPANVTRQLSYRFDYNGGTGKDGTSKAYAGVTNADSLVVEPPEDPVREGYLFMGWATKDGTMWTDFSTPITEDLNLYAVWKPLSACTVTFETGTSQVLQPQTVAAGETIEPPQIPLWDGYRFLGWYVDEETPWDFSTPVTGDMTLYAKWTYDHFNFINSSSAFGQGGTYELTGDYLEALQSGLTSAQWELVNQNMVEPWGGSCFGMAAVYSLRYAGQIHPGAFQTGADVLYDLKTPVQSETTRNLINYYYLQQFRPESMDLALAFYPEMAVDGAYARKLVEELEQTGKPVVICFVFGRTATVDDLRDANNTELYGHAVVGLNGTKNADGSYQINIWDPNSRQMDSLTISADYRTADFQSGSYPNAKIKGSLPVVYSDTTYDHLNIEDYLASRRGSGAAVVSDGQVILQDITLGDLTITAADGSYAVFQDGSYVSGTLEPAVGLMSDGSNGQASMSYAFPYSSSYELSTSADEAGTVDLLMGEYYVSVESDGLKSLTVTDDGQISVSSDRAAAQTLSVTSDALGDSWNTVTISGTDTGLTVDMGDEAVTVTSDNNISASVTGSNVFTQKTGAAQTVAVTPGGTKVSTSTGSVTAEETPSQPAVGTDNPFTDVPDGAYYKDAVLWAVESGVTNGTSATTFGPDVVCSRAQAVTFLWRASGSPEPSTTVNPFTDVSAGAYYYKAVLWAVESGITNGTSATTFSPDAPCSRGQIVTFLWRTQGGPEGAAGSTFADVAGSAYYAKAVAWAVANNITNGTSATTFSPDANCTRAQIVTFLWRLMA